MPAQDYSLDVAAIPGAPVINLAHPCTQAQVIAATVAGVAQQLLQQSNGRRSLWTVMNLSSTGTLWCSKSDPAPAPNKPGCYPLFPGAFEQFTAPGYVPLNALYVISDGSTIPVTIELG